MTASRSPSLRPLLVIDIPGLSLAQIGVETPNLAGLPGRAGMMPVFPAVTMPAHAAMVTGRVPSQSGIVANGWFVREHNEVMMWRQSERLVEGERVWEAGRKRHADFTCLKHFWWPGMATTADWGVNVRPVYFADGRKGGDVYCNDPTVTAELRRRFGDFPLFQFWGPGTSVVSSRWIAESAAWLLAEKRPTLALVYLPHMDYNQQRVGPDHPSIRRDLQETDAVAGDLIKQATALGYDILVVSDYQIVPVSRPVHINRFLRSKGWLRTTRNAAGELIDYGTSTAFAVADHQTAQIYVDKPELIPVIAEAVAALPGVHQVWHGAKRQAIGLAHDRAGDIIVAADADAWFTYYYWEDPALAPDFARTVAIHAKPGYDPCEMLLDPAIYMPKLRIGAKVLAKKLGMRTLFNFCPLDAALIRGSHGLLPATTQESPVLLSSRTLPDGAIQMIDIPELMLASIFGD